MAPVGKSDPVVICPELLAFRFFVQEFSPTLDPSPAAFCGRPVAGWPSASPAHYHPRLPHRQWPPPKPRLPHRQWPPPKPRLPHRQ
jgi:hypothetical protein